MKYFIQPFLLFILPILQMSMSNPGEIFIFDVFAFCTLLGIFLVVVQWVLVKCFRDKERVAFALSILCSALLFSAHLPSKVFWIWSFCLAAFLLLLYIPIVKSIKAVAYKCLILPLLLIVSFDIIQIALAKQRINDEIAKRAPSIPSKTLEKNFAGNIFVIILDEFISEKSFNEYYGVDNGIFFDYLRNRGFRLIPNSTSNYPWTLASVPSIVNFQYHDTNLSKYEFSGVSHELVRNSRLFHILKNEGYTIHHLPCVYWVGNPEEGLLADCLFRIKSYGLFQSLSSLTPWSDRYRKFQRHNHFYQALEQFEELEKVAEMPGKHLAFAHIMSPHRPIVFDEHGHFLNGNDVNMAEKDFNHKYYLSQAMYISKRVTETIDHILTKSKENPIIIVLSDHGRFPIGCVAKGKLTLPFDELAWRFSNLQALYLPGFQEEFQANTTPVNSIRAILAHYFGYDLPQTEDNCCFHFSELKHSVPNTTMLQHMVAPTF